MPMRSASTWSAVKSSDAMPPDAVFGGFFYHSRLSISFAEQCSARHRENSISADMLFSALSSPDMVCRLQPALAANSSCVIRRLRRSILIFSPI